MKHSPGIIEAILEQKNQGLSSRQIANNLGIGKTSVNKYVALTQQKRETAEPLKLRIAVLDIETSASKVYCFGRFDQNITQNAVAEEGGKILVACWKWLGDTEVQRLYMTPTEIANQDDSSIVAILYDLYEKADAIVMHNGKKFDHRMVQTRGVYHGYGKLPTIKVIDTLEMAKKVLRLPSNKLDSIGAYFGLGRKEVTTGIDLWKRVQENEEGAMKEMVSYCIQDVELLEAVYYQLQALGTTGFNAGQYFNDDKIRCRSCGSHNVSNTGRHVHTGVGKYEELQCNDCGHTQRGSQTVNTKEKRKSLTRAI